MRPVRTTVSYRIGLAVVAFGMLLLPLAYLGLIALTLGGVVWHATANFTLLKTYRSLIGLALYLLPLLFGGFLVVFMFKPFFARKAAQQRKRRIKREAEPCLYDFVEQIAATVGAPAPRSIRVDCNVNAAASFRNGIWSMFGSDLTLTIGLPLVAGVSVRQLAGVLAHEFGHFTQGAGMRMSYLIRITSFWLMRTVYERDAWDEWLYRMSKESRFYLQAVFYPARFFVWVTRLLLWCLMSTGHVISCYLLRQMEYDADRYETRLVGADTFAATAKKLVDLNVSHQMAFGDLRQFWDEGRLADDLPALIVANIKFITPKIRNDLQKLHREQRTELFDTHPADRDRIASARLEKSVALFRLPRELAATPATVIFRDFESTCKKVTLLYYREDLELTVRRNELHPVKELLERQNVEIEAGKSLHRYFQVRIPPLWPLPISSFALQPSVDPNRTRDEMKRSRKQMLDAIPSYKRLEKKYEEAEERLYAATAALALLDVGFRIKPAEYQLKEGTQRAASNLYNKAQRRLADLASGMLAFESAAGARLTAAVQLLQDDRVVQRLENGDELKREVEVLLPEAVFVSELMGELRTFRVLYHKVSVLYSQIDGNEENFDLITAILGQLHTLHRRLKSIDGRLQQRLYPFDHANDEMTLREFVLPVIPDPDDLGNLMEITSFMFERLVTIQLRLFARLAFAAEKAARLTADDVSGNRDQYRGSARTFLGTENADVRAAGLHGRLNRIAGNSDFADDPFRGFEPDFRAGRFAILVLRCQTGDEAAFAQIVERFHPRVAYFVRKMLADTHRVEDVLQNVWLDVFRGIRSLRNPDALSTWLFRVARDHVYRLHRKRKIATTELNVNDVASDEVPTFQPEDASRIHDALDRLSPEHREVLVLRFLDDLNYAQIAEITSCEIGTVKSRMHYAKRALKQILEREDHHE
eukprot:g26630.t1